MTSQINLVGELPSQTDVIHELPSHSGSLFAIQNQDDLLVKYRLLSIDGVPRGDHFDKNLNRLLRDVQYELKAPVALLSRAGSPYLAIPSTSPDPKPERRLMPHVAQLHADDREYTLAFGEIAPEDVPVACSFLQWALRGSLFHERRLWTQGTNYYSKTPLQGGDSQDVDIYPGFSWRVVPLADGRLMLGIDVTSRFVDRIWLTERLSRGDFAITRGRNCLYHFGHQWYVVQFQALLPTSISDHRIWPAGAAQSVDLYKYIQDKWGGNSPAWVRTLNPKSPAMLYRAGNENEMAAAAGLCKLVLPTSDPAVSRLQRQTVLEPTNRFRRIEQVVSRYLSQVSLVGQRVIVSRVPERLAPEKFAIPAQRFGTNRVLAVAGRRDRASATDRQPLNGFARRRLQMVRDPKIGPYDSSPFGPQYLLLPESLPRAINDDFSAKLTAAMGQVSGQQYQARRILYDDRGARNLVRQVGSITDALRKSSVTSGYGLVVLPPGAHPDLHNFLKRSLWPNLQLQCAMAHKIQGLYGQSEGRWQPKSESRLESYALNCALGLMVVNRKWLWVLDDPLWYDVYVGIDVLNQMAGITFLYNGGRNIFFDNYPVKQKEKLSSRQLRKILHEHLRTDLRRLGLRPKSIVIHRDGRAYASEIDGLRSAIEDLVLESLVPSDVVTGVVEVRKSAAEPIRLVQGTDLESMMNPEVGTYLRLRDREGILCTTGSPFDIPGTAKPLSVHIADGPLDLDKVMEDIFHLSQLVYTAPDKCARLPLTIKLADDLLQPIAGEADEEEAKYEPDDAEQGDEHEIAG
jgi:hypothetical protein